MNFQKSLCSCALDDSTHSIRRVKCEIAFSLFRDTRTYSLSVEMQIPMIEVYLGKVD